MSPQVGVGFSQRAHGDLRYDLNARQVWADNNDAPTQWATVRQTHGAGVLEVSGPGDAGSADALFTTRRGMGIAVFTADCAGVVLSADDMVGVAHSGWRGALAGVVPALSEAMAVSGGVIATARIGPMIGPCCFEVGEEVAAQFGPYRATTTWGTTSVDLRRFLADQLRGLEVVVSESCTFHDLANWSHRRAGTPERMAAVAWLP